MQTSRAGLSRVLTIAICFGSLMSAPSALADGIGETSSDGVTGCQEDFARFGIFDPNTLPHGQLDGSTACAKGWSRESQEFLDERTDHESAADLVRIRAEMVAEGVDVLLEAVNQVHGSVTEVGVDVGLKFGFVPSPKSCLEALSYCTNADNHVGVTSSLTAAPSTQSSTTEITYQMYLSNKVTLAPASADAEANVRFNIFSETDSAETSKQEHGLHAAYDYYAVSQWGTATPTSGCANGYCAEVHALEIGIKDTTEEVIVAELSPEGIDTYGTAGSTTVTAAINLGSAAKIGVSNGWDRPRGESGGGVYQGFSKYEGVWRDLDGGSRTAKGLRTTTLWEAPKGTAPWWIFSTALWYDGPCYRTDWCA